MDEWAESDLAWELAERLGSALPDDERAAVYAMVGAGNSYAAIVKLLEAGTHANYPIPSSLLDRVADWLDGYKHSADAGRLQTLLHIIIRGTASGD